MGFALIHYHGTPITPDDVAVKILKGRHGLVSFAHPNQMSLVAEVCPSYVIDNGAFTAWKRKYVADWFDYYVFVEDWKRHPGFDWALIPDVIDGDEDANDALVAEWPHGSVAGVPVWHLHESFERLLRLAQTFPRLAFGSSGAYAVVGTPLWWGRMTEALETICPDGAPITKLHGLRMLDPKVFTRIPFASADSTNIARNINIDKRWKGTYTPATKAARGVVIAERIEAHQSAAIWQSRNCD